MTLLTMHAWLPCGIIWLKNNKLSEKTRLRQFCSSPRCGKGTKPPLSSNNLIPQYPPATCWRAAVKAHAARPRSQEGQMRAAWCSDDIIIGSGQRRLRRRLPHNGYLFDCSRLPSLMLMPLKQPDPWLRIEIAVPRRNIIERMSAGVVHPASAAVPTSRSTHPSHVL